jgi:hypothetical protein
MPGAASARVPSSGQRAQRMGSPSTRRAPLPQCEMRVRSASRFIRLDAFCSPAKGCPRWTLESCGSNMGVTLHGLAFGIPAAGTKGTRVTNRLRSSRSIPLGELARPYSETADTRTPYRAEKSANRARARSTVRFVHSTDGPPRSATPAAMAPKHRTRRWFRLPTFWPGMPWSQPAVFRYDRVDRGAGKARPNAWVVGVQANPDRTPGWSATAPKRTSTDDAEEMCRAARECVPLLAGMRR